MRDAHYGHLMPGAPPVPPPDDEYRPSLLDRLGPDGALIVRARMTAAIAFVVLFPILIRAAEKRELTAGHPFSTALVGALAGACFLYWAQRRMTSMAGAAALAVVFPDGSH